MAIWKRLLAAGAAALAVSLSLVPSPAVAAADTESAGKAAGYLVSNLVDGDHLKAELGDASVTADGVLALVAAGRAQDAATIEAMTGYLAKQAPTYATSGEAAAKLTLVALATGKDPAAFGGTDLVKVVKGAVKKDGSFGAYPGPYASGLGLIALAKTKSEIPPAMVDWLVKQANKSGGWGYAADQPVDADSTGMAILGLKALPAPTAKATTAMAAGIKWADGAQQQNGSWAGFAPANSTALLGSALQATGSGEPEAVAYLTGLQQPDGGLLTGADGGKTSDLLATAQGALLLAGASYLSPVPAAATPTPASSCTGVWVVVDASKVGGKVTTQCATAFSNGTEALTSAGHTTARSGTMLCQIDGAPERCEVTPSAYWSYWQAAPEGDHYGAWVYATLGPDSYQPKAGAAEGWVYGDGHTPPSALPQTLAVADQPATSSAPSPTSATPTPAPSGSSGLGGPLGIGIVVAVAVIAGLGVWLARRRAR